MDESSVYNEGAIRDIGIAKQAVASQLPLSEQEKSVADLHEAIKTLSARLHSVLAPEREADDRKLAEDGRAEASPLREQLIANNRGIQRAANLVRGLVERLEV